MKKIQIILSIVLGLGLLIGLNVLVQKLDFRLDLTKNKRYSLSPQSKKILHHLKHKVTALCFYRPGDNGKEQLESILNLYARESKNFSYEFIDPDRAPALAKEYEIYQSGQVVLLQGKKKEKLLFPDEEKLTNALIRLSEEAKGKFYLVKGHGEISLLGSGRAITKLTSLINDEGLQIKELSLLGLKKIPGDALGVLILGPNKDFLQSELDLLSQYLNHGGRLLIAYGPEETSNITQWIETSFGWKPLNGYILDPLGKLVVGSFGVAIAQSYSYHPITADFNVITVFPTARALEQVKNSQKSPWKTELLLKTGPGAWLETDLASLKQGRAQFDPKTDQKGPLVFAFWGERRLGGAKDKSKLARVLVFGDDDFFTDNYLNLGGNKDLIRNSLNWLREKGELLSISKTKAENVFLFLSPVEKMILSWVPLIIVPVFCLFWAILVAVRRKRIG